MNKLNREITKSLKQIKADAFDKVKKIFKQKDVVLIDCTRWNVPRESDFKSYGADAKLYIKSLDRYMITKIGTYEIDNMLVEPGDAYEFVTKEEIKNFEKNIYPKLYAKWSAEQKQKIAEKRAANAKDAGKLRAKIAKLQAKLDALQEN